MDRNRILRIPGAIFVWILLAGANGFGQTSQPVVSADSTTPKGALKALALAINDGDGPRIRGLLTATTPNEQKMVDAMSDTAVALAGLGRAMVDRFGQEQTNSAMGDTAGQLKQSLANIDSGKEKIVDDSAVVTIAPGPRGTMLLKKVDGAWKLSLAERTQSLAPQQIDAYMNTLASQLKALGDVTADVRAGKYDTAGQAVKSLGSKMNASPAPASPTTAASGN
jgi:hypothetical protein